MPAPAVPHLHLVPTDRLTVSRPRRRLRWALILPLLGTAVFWGVAALFIRAAWIAARAAYL